jgi:hypothetical protein
VQLRCRTAEQVVEDGVQSHPHVAVGHAFPHSGPRPLIVKQAEDGRHVLVDKRPVEHGVHGVVAEGLSHDLGQQLEHRGRGYPQLRLDGVHEVRMSGAQAACERNGRSRYQSFSEKRQQPQERAIHQTAGGAAPP